MMRKSLAAIQLLLLDVDGVLTDGSITYTQSGEEIKRFNARDGLGIRLLLEAGIKVGIITGRSSGALNKRCENLGIEMLYDGIRDKKAVLETIFEETGLLPGEVAFVGDDLVDLPVMKKAGISVAVADAAVEVIQAADIVTTLPGGRGAVRQVCEKILKAKGVWEEILVGFSS